MRDPDRIVEKIRADFIAFFNFGFCDVMEEKSSMSYFNAVRQVLRVNPSLDQANILERQNMSPLWRVCIIRALNSADVTGEVKTNSSHGFRAENSKVAGSNPDLAGNQIRGYGFRPPFFFAQCVRSVSSLGILFV